MADGRHRVPIACGMPPNRSCTLHRPSLDDAPLVDSPSYIRLLSEFLVMHTKNMIGITLTFLNLLERTIEGTEKRT